MCKGRMQSSQPESGDSAETDAGAGGEAVELRILMEDKVFGDRRIHTWNTAKF